MHSTKIEVQGEEVAYEIADLLPLKKKGVILLFASGAFNV